MKKIPENMMLIIKAIIPLVVIVLLFFFLANIGFNKISQVRDEISQAKVDQSVLINKIDLLRTVSVNGAKDSDVTLNSLPDSSPALLVVSQLKNLAAGSGLILSTIKSGVDQSSNDLKSVSVDFKVTGDKSAIQTFLMNIRTIAPITALSKVKITELNGVYSGEIGVNSFWSPLPTQLPTTIEGFQELTDEDKQMLTTVSSLIQPTFIDLPAAESSGRQNPFAK